MGKRLCLVETNVDKLHRVSTEVNLSDVSTVYMIESDLMSVYNKLNGCIQGLAAVQVGHTYRAMLLRYVKGKEPIIIFNPKVELKFGSKTSYERCQSELDVQYAVKRPLLVKVSYWNKYKERVTEWLPYKKARIFMHEFDHLNGVLLQDKGRAIG